MPFKPFIPDYVPAFGEVDDFIKIPRPDGKPDDLGTEVETVELLQKRLQKFFQVLDEPCIKQSDASILELKLRPFFDQGDIMDADIKKIDHNNPKKPERINEWIEVMHFTPCLY